eukprot:gnl/MRDRNA2_/MRDRNA2_139346_c0_seq1.p1 gnl/MRDRNA2_/MRDRNA2_139346_c0~~gnl/MRDRNA2_/MRDRNA2_139346_c0_seq1.p1  ORF type:complete len:1095 (+),score=201.79 gnl/MRDRNA2_/MRDRNA2_139346_c0_seq1:229-3285(+)
MAIALAQALELLGFDELSRIDVFVLADDKLGETQRLLSAFAGLGKLKSTGTPSEQLNLGSQAKDNYHDESRQSTAISDCPTRLSGSSFWDGLEPSDAEIVHIQRASDWMREVVGSLTSATPPPMHDVNEQINELSKDIALEVLPQGGGEASEELAPGLVVAAKHTMQANAVAARKSKAEVAARYIGALTERLLSQLSDLPTNPEKEVVSSSPLPEIVAKQCLQTLTDAVFSNLSATHGEDARIQGERRRTLQSVEARCVCRGGARSSRSLSPGSKSAPLLGSYKHSTMGQENAHLHRASERVAEQVLSVNGHILDLEAASTKACVAEIAGGIITSAVGSAKTALRDVSPTNNFDQETLAVKISHDASQDVIALSELVVAKLETSKGLPKASVEHNGNVSNGCPRQSSKADATQYLQAIAADVFNHPEVAASSTELRAQTFLEVQQIFQSVDSSSDPVRRALSWQDSPVPNKAIPKAGHMSSGVSAGIPESQEAVLQSIRIWIIEQSHGPEERPEEIERKVNHADVCNRIVNTIVERTTPQNGASVTVPAAAFIRGLTNDVLTDVMQPNSVQATVLNAGRYLHAISNGVFAAAAGADAMYAAEQRKMTQQHLDEILKGSPSGHPSVSPRQRVKESQAAAGYALKQQLLTLHHLETTTRQLADSKKQLQEAALEVARLESENMRLTSKVHEHEKVGKDAGVMLERLLAFLKVHGFVPDAALKKEAQQLLSQLGAFNANKVTVKNDINKSGSQQPMSTPRSQAAPQQAFFSWRSAGGRGSLHQLPVQGNLIVSRPRACKAHEELSKHQGGTIDARTPPIHRAHSTPRMGPALAPVDRNRSGAAALAQAIRSQAHSRANSRERHPFQVAPSPEWHGQVTFPSANMVRAPSAGSVPLAHPGSIGHIHTPPAGAVARTPSVGAVSTSAPSGSRARTPSPGAVSSARVPIMRPGVDGPQLNQLSPQFLGSQGISVVPLSSRAISPRPYVPETPPRGRLEGLMTTKVGSASPAFPSQIGGHRLRYS